MKIKTVTIDNFRNLKHFVIDATISTIISGKNKLGKSNALNALVWFFTDTIYTDNSGVGENDINSIVPKDQVKGEHTSVSVEFLDGPTFTKTYKTGYDRLTGKANKHTTEGSINNVACKNMQEFNSRLMDVLGFSPTFTSVKELNLFIDPLYALQKLDAKQLRTLLVSFGCTATNEELFKLGFDDLRQYENKYLGDFVNMRLDLKKQSKTIQESLKRIEILLSQFNNIEEFDNSKLEAISSTIEELTKQKANLENNGNSEAIKAYEYQLKEIKLKLQTELDKKVAELNLSIKELEGKKALELENIDRKKYQETIDIRNNISSLTSEISSIRTSIVAYTNSITTLRSNLNTTKTAAQNIVAKKTDYQAKLVASKERVFTGYMLCPCCGYSFSPDEDAEKQFNEHKQKDIEFYTEQIAQFNKDIDNYNKECKEIVTNANNTKAEISKLETSVTKAEEELNAYKKALIEINNKPVDRSSIELLDAQINQLKADISNIQAAGINNPQITDLEVKINEMKTDADSAMKLQLFDIEDAIEDAEAKREELYIERSSWNQKLEYQKKLLEVTEAWNNVEALIERVNEFIHAMINLINTKAKAKTGMDFVMLEENLGNDGVKEVCYAVVDGVPFSMINTAQKYECGIKFIEKVKEIAVNDFGKKHNDLPILADKFEGIDEIQKIKSFTQEQLICTRVGLESTITIL